MKRCSLRKKQLVSDDSAITNGAVPLPRITVWDLPVRVFHWTLVVLVAFSLWSGYAKDDALTYHMWSGYAILTLVISRVVWGFVGSTHARFSDFLYGPRTILAYLHGVFTRGTQRFLGHNPAGGVSVVLMLACLLLQAGTGLFANDDIVTEGPLYKWVSKATSDLLTTIHKYNVNVLWALLAIHILAVLFYLFHKSENLIKPMFTGYKLRPSGAEVRPARLASTWLAVVLLAVASCAVFLLVRK